MAVSSNISPSFARDAATFLREANYQRALELCLAGTQVFPTYSTGFLVLGKSYDAIGRTVEALMAYRQALSILPDNPMLISLVRHAEERERQEFRQFREEQRKRLASQPAATFVEQKPEPPQEESAIEYLAKRLQDVKRIQPAPAETGTRSSSTLPYDYKSLKFVTVTMAEIYAGQGEYAEAIEAYRELIKQHPDHIPEYEKRIGEIQLLLDTQQSDKTLKGPSNENAS